MSRIKKIFTLDIALQLKDMGNEILFTEPTKTYPNLKVLVFRDTDKFRQDFKSLNENK